MRNDAATAGRSPRTGRFSFRAISSLLRNVSTSNIAGTVRSAGASLASVVNLVEEERQREQVQWAGFDTLDLGPYNIRHVLLLIYMNGFQIWDVEEADNVKELVSKRDGNVAFLRIQPRPYTKDILDGALKSSWPLLIVVTGDSARSERGIVPDGYRNGNIDDVSSFRTAGSSHFVPTIVRFYSLCSHTYVHFLKFRTAIYAIRCSPRVVVVALASQIYCFDTATLQNTFSALTYPSPQAGIGGLNSGFGALAVGSRWLAYAANQPFISNTGRVSPQHLTPSPGVSPSTSPANGSIVAHYAKESSKHIAAGIVTLGDIGYKKLSRYYTELLPDGASSPGSGNPYSKSNNFGLGVHTHDPEHAGTVIVRDYINKTVIAQFRAHTSPLSALCFDPSGTLLVTASVYGHNLNIFRLTPASAAYAASPTSSDASASYVHLYKLCRGMTQAVIQDISFSYDSHWIAISSSRGTSHLFAISPFSGMVGPHTHSLLAVSGVCGILSSKPAFTWWCTSEPIKANQQTVPPSTMTLSVISRIKNGNGGLCGTVNGAAAAATGRNSSAGAIAVLFHDGRGQNLQPDVNPNFLKDQLWVFSPPGHLIRHALKSPSLGTGGLHSTDCSFSSNSVRASQTQNLRAVVEPLQKWDLCRRPNWEEREEKIDMSDNPADVLQKSCMAEGDNSAAVTTGDNHIQRQQNASSVVGEVHCSYISNAEVQTQTKPPIWLKSEISFHVFMGEPTNEPPVTEKVGEIEVETFPTQVVEVRRKDLVPVYERLQNLRTRDPVMEVLHGLSELNAHPLKDDNLQDGFIGMHVEVAQIQRSSSGSSSGSEGGLFGGTTTVLNGFHPSHQDS